MTQAKTGDKVTVHYTGRLERGEVFDSSECHEGDDCGCDPGPMEFTIGEGEVIPGFEKAVIGMSPGEAKTVTFPSARPMASGWTRWWRWSRARRSRPISKPEVGLSLEVTQENGNVFPVLITEVTDDIGHP